MGYEGEWRYQEGLDEPMKMSSTSVRFGHQSTNASGCLADYDYPRIFSTSVRRLPILTPDLSASSCG